MTEVSGACFLILDFARRFPDGFELLILIRNNVIFNFLEEIRS